jgi:hypothetical protein
MLIRQSFKSITLIAISIAGIAFNCSYGSSGSSVTKNPSGQTPPVSREAGAVNPSGLPSSGGDVSGTANSVNNSTATTNSGIDQIDPSIINQAIKNTGANINLDNDGRPIVNNVDIDVSEIITAEKNELQKSKTMQIIKRANSLYIE